MILLLGGHFAILKDVWFVITGDRRVVFLVSSGWKPKMSHIPADLRTALSLQNYLNQNGDKCYDRKNLTKCRIWHMENLNVGFLTRGIW